MGVRRLAVALAALCVGVGPAPADLGVHDDYYLGFAQGAYYGLMLAGEDYHVAWCMKGELEFAGAGIGTGGEFQQALEGLLAGCRQSYAPDRADSPN